jgi:hypothetical protein
MANRDWCGGPVQHAGRQPAKSKAINISNDASQRRSRPEQLGTEDR